MAEDEKPPEFVLELDKVDADNRSLGEALEAAARVANPLSNKLLAIEKMSGLSRMTETIRMLEENSGMRRVADSLRLFEENSSLKQFHDRMRLFEENSTIKQFSERMRLFDENSSIKRIADSLSVTGELALLISLVTSAPGKTLPNCQRVGESGSLDVLSGFSGGQNHPVAAEARPESGVSRLCFLSLYRSASRPIRRRRAAFD
jgi:hypothetical protein